MSATDAGNGAVVLFDVDLTLVATSSFWGLGRALAREGVILPSDIVSMAIEHMLYTLGRRSLSEVMGRAYRMIEGCEISRVEACAESVVRDLIASALYAEAVARIEMHQTRGDRVVLASAAPAFIVERIGRYVGVVEVIATEYERIGTRFGRVVEPQAFGPGKVALARRAGLLSAGRPHVYTDHAEDMDLVLISGFATLMNPMYKLVREARRRGIAHETVRWTRVVGS